MLLSSAMRNTLVAVVAMFVCAPSSSESNPSQETIAAHMAAATAAARDDLKPLMTLCKPAPAQKPSQEQVDQLLAEAVSEPRPAPGKAFDNLYFVGTKWVSSWAIKTSDGIILIDALNNADEAKALIVDGLRKTRIDPAQIKYVIVTHGHGDHYGGVPFLVQGYHPRVVMSAADWAMTETRLEFTSALWSAPPKRDITVNDGDEIRLGDTVVKLYLTPGHTMGTLSPVFDVRDGNTTHRVMLWGGTSFNFGKDLPRLTSYIQSTARMQSLAAQQHIDVLISNHSGFDDSLQKLASIQVGSAEPNPFVMGTPAVERALTVMRECAEATSDRFELEP
jgi:metallo-beta-lactamase class B